ncbi:MAG TPA: NAD(+) diphosphatase, partial [Anaeromyxobacteraceae bacterium]|nr:NAD(+) diphosphatase [Anaeromyxobacteraceae bacterium]
PGVPDSGEAGLWILFRAGSLVLESVSGQASPLMEAFPEGVDLEESILMGAWDGRPLRIAEVGKEAELPAHLRAEPLQQLLFREALGDELLTLAGRAQQILDWEQSSAACSRCRGTPQRIAGTWGKRCGRCGCERFPHIHPCTLVLVRRADDLLLVRKPGWPKGYYSLPAGFCDFAESLEECACREVKEETGIEVSNLRYCGSQSWPFPSQLMLGFTAEYAGGEIAIDRSELEDAAWFALDALPPTFTDKAIASWLIDRERAGHAPG